LWCDKKVNKVFVISILLLSIVSLFGCTGRDIVLPYTTSQMIAQSTDLNYALFVDGYYDGNFLTIDGNKLGVSVIDFNDENIPWSSLIDFPSGCGENQAVKIVGNELVCVDLPVDTNFETAGYGENSLIDWTNASENLDTSGNITSGGSTLTLGSGFSIENEGGSYWQRIQTVDSAVDDTNAFCFETRNGSGAYLGNFCVQNDGDATIRKNLTANDITANEYNVSNTGNFFIDVNGDWVFCDNNSGC